MNNSANDITPCAMLSGARMLAYAGIWFERPLSMFGRVSSHTQFVIPAQNQAPPKHQ